MRAILHLFFIGFVFSSCQDESLNILDSTSNVFKLHEVSIENTTLEIKVSYSGGCSEHGFEIIWPDAITAIYPPDFSITLIHDANGDMCEAYLTEIRSFDLIDNPLGLSSNAIANMRISVINGSNTEEVVSNK